MIYLDNAATSFPKPDGVLHETCRAIFSPLGNPGRSGHPYSKRSAEMVFFAREMIAGLLGTKAENVVLTSGATAALNLAICGVVEELGKRRRLPYVVTTVFEHNSVLRPLFLLEKRGKIRLKILSPSKDGTFSPELLFRSPPDILAITLRSNVTGRDFSLWKFALQLARSGTVIIGDGAQAVGMCDTSFQKTGVHILCAPGHKGLLGIMGAGFLALSENCPVIPAPLLAGGTGGDTFHPFMPALPPERLEAGTLPVPAVFSMALGAEFVMKKGLASIQYHERLLKRLLVKSLSSLSSYILYETEFPDGPLLINHKNLPSEKAAALLSDKGLFVRGGFHCAPLAHRYLKTEEHGGLRLSPGLFTTKEEIFEALNILESI